PLAEQGVARGTAAGAPRPRRLVALARRGRLEPVPLALPGVRWERHVAAGGGIEAVPGYRAAVRVQLAQRGQERRALVAAPPQRSDRVPLVAACGQALADGSR